MDFKIGERLVRRAIVLPDVIDQIQTRACRRLICKLSHHFFYRCST
jgi:hypothetical protein